MTITRLGQVAADMRCNEEFITQVYLDAPTISSTQARTGTYSITNPSDKRFGIGFPGVERAIRAACHVYLETPIFKAPDHDILYATIMGDTEPIAFGIRIDWSTQEFIFYIDGSEYGRIKKAEIQTNTWIHVGLAIDLESGYVGYFLNSEKLLNYENEIPFWPTSGFNAIWATSDSNRDGLYCDNLYVDRISGSDIYDTPPRKLFYFKDISGPGTFDAWSQVGAATNYQAVDDPAAHNSDTDYNKTLSTGQIDTFSFNSVNIPNDTSEIAYRIRAIVPQLISKRENTGQDATLRMLAYDGGSFKYGDDQSGLGPGYMLFWDRFETQPDGSAWTEDDLNNMEYGYQSRGTF